MKRFAEQTVVVTGASRGLGRSIAIAFGREGAHVYAGYRAQLAGAEQTLSELSGAGGSGAVLGFDVTRSEAVEAAVRRVVGERGQVDVWVNCAAVARDNLFPLMAAEEWSEPIDVNLSGVYRCCRAVARHMLGRRSGAIINVASVAGIHASPGQAGYSASKGGLLAFNRTLAAELGPYGVRVNAVVPGLLATGMAARLNRNVLEEKRRRIPLGRLGSGEEVAEAVLFLASSAASYVIGQALVVDGGLTL